MLVSRDTAVFSFNLLVTFHSDFYFRTGTFAVIPCLLVRTMTTSHSLTTADLNIWTPNKIHQQIRNEWEYLSFSHLKV